MSSVAVSRLSSLSPKLSPELRALVRVSVAWLGRVICRDAGEEQFTRIERIRGRMARLRGASAQASVGTLASVLAELRTLSPKQRCETARAFTLMLELMNACEAAYRSYRLRRRPPVSGFATDSEGIIFVLTAHPTEARSPDNIALFHRIQQTLLAWLEEGGISRDVGRDRLPDHPRGIREEELLHLLELAWRMPIARGRKPDVEDEAEHLYSILLRQENLESLLQANRRIAPVLVRTWVGGDKDGNPFVDARRMVQSLTLARRRLAVEAAICVQQAARDLLALPGRERPRGVIDQLRMAERFARKLAAIKGGDGGRLCRFRSVVERAASAYVEAIGAENPSLLRLGNMIRMFPALLVPLELRESSEQVTAAAQGGRGPIVRMLETLARIARGGDPLWYARGFIISMVSSAEEVDAGIRLIDRVFGTPAIPVIPLFEEGRALRDSPAIMRALLARPGYREALRKKLGGQVEVMLGYSDSAKEMGVLASRMAIARAVSALDGVITRRHMRPVFFHGSGGSVDRGGGSIDEQTSWWPSSALTLYKATVQGEMVERTFASPEILTVQLERIARRVAEGVASPAPVPVPSPELKRLARRASRAYRALLAGPLFLEMVEQATVYPYLDLLKIGSRPTKRKRVLAVSALRAIPWVLCWTQARILLPTWWGIGEAWERTNPDERRALAREFRSNDLFRSFVKALGFTLAKVELAVFEVQARRWLDRPGSGEQADRRSLLKRLAHEYHLACEFVRTVSEDRSLLWFRPWLGTSILLRSPMIHPLNLLQIIAMEERDARLMRETVTGISCGMMTTG
jgi:phosphoenolpyruvate carboxylase